MQSKFRKLMALCLATALVVTSMAVGFSAIALGSTNLLADLTLSDTTGITMDAANNGFTAVGDANGYATAYFNDLTLEKNSSYEYSFDITFHSDPTGQIPRFALRDGGQWFNFIGTWGQQGRFNDTNDINPLIGLLSLSLTANTTYNFTFELEPTRARLLIDGVAQVNTAGNTDAEGWVTLPAVKDGKIGIDTAHGANFTMANISLIKTVQGTSTTPEDVIAAINAIGEIDAYSREAIDNARDLYNELSADDQALVTNASALTAAETAFAGLNLLADLSVSDTTGAAVVDASTNSVKITAGSSPIYFNDLVLDRDTTYVYEFDMIYHGAYNATFPWLILRDGGQYINAGAYGCIRVCDNLNFDDFEANSGMSANAGIPVSFKIIMEPSRVKVYINGTAVAFGGNTGVTVEDGWVPIAAVANGKIGVTGGNAGFTYTMANISLTKVGESAGDPAVTATESAIAAIGTVNAYSRETIEAARVLFDSLTAEQQAKVTNAAALPAAEAAFAAMNLLTDLSVSNGDAAVVDKDTNSVKITAGNTIYFNDLTLKKNSTYVYEFDIIYDGAYNATFPWLVLREGGQYVNMGCYTQMRVCDNLNFDDFEAWGAMSVLAGDPLSVKIIMEPERIQVYFDGEMVICKDTVGADLTDGWITLPAVKNGKFGVTGGNAGFTYTLSGISLTEIPGEEEDDGAVVVAETIAAIDAIGTVDATSGLLIKAARAAYDTLTAEQQAQVTNASALTAAESAYAALNLLADATLTANGVATLENGTLSVDGSSQEAGGIFYFDGLKLKENATYVYDFDLTMNAPLNTNLITMALRDDGAGNGQFLGFWGSTNQVRICKTSDTNAFEDIYNPFGLEANKVYSFHIVMEPERVLIYVDGVLRKAALCTDPNGWTALPSVKDGLLGIYYDVGTSITLDNLWLGVVGAEDIAAAEAVDALIDAIGKVTLQSGDAIGEAEAAYAQLTDAQKAYVTGYATLTAARADYDLLVAQDQASAADKEAAKAVMDKIDAIGTVTTASKAAIEDAEAAYAALSNNQKTLVTNYGDLTAARTAYDNAVEAEKVDKLIADIGTVTAESADAIQAARAAYDALTADQKALVSGLSTLEKAEKAFAALDGTKDVYYYYPSVNDLMGANYWPNNVMQSAVSTGGIHYRWFNAGTDWRSGLNIPLELDGLHLTLGNISFTSDLKKFIICMADKDSQEAYTASSKAPLIFIFNCETGELKVSSESHIDAGETIIQTDALKAENLIGKQVELKLTANSDGGYTVSLLGETGTVTKAMLDAAMALTDYENVYLTMSPWDWGAAVQLEFDLLAVHGGESICSDDLSADQLAAIDSVIAKIDAIGAEITEESESAITAARAAYDALGATEQSFVSNYAALVNAEWKLQSLKAEAGIEYKDKDYYRPSSNDTMGTNYWTNNLFISDLAEGGIHFEWNMTGTDWRMGIGKELTLDGLHLVFSNLKYTSANKRFVVYIHDLRDGAEDWGAGYASIGNQPLMIVFDGNNGLVKACTENMVEPTGTVLIESPALLAENMEGKDFDLKITANDDGTYTLSVMGMEAILTKELLASAVGLTEYEEVYVTLCPWDWTTSTVMNLDLVAIHGGKEICADEVTEEVLAEINGTIETIKAIFNEKGQVTPASYENLIKAREMYEALDDYVKGVVENYQDLVDAEEIYEIVEAIAGIGTVTAEKADAVAILNDMYKALDAYKRPMVGNYLVLRDALLDVYLLERGEKEEATTPDGGDSNVPGGSDGPTSPVTGEGMLTLALALMTAAAAAGVMLVSKRKNTNVQ